MERKIVRIGNSYGVIIPKHILKVMGWDVRALQATIDTHKEELIISNPKKKK